MGRVLCVNIFCPLLLSSSCISLQLTRTVPPSVPPSCGAGHSDSCKSHSMEPPKEFNVFNLKLDLRSIMSSPRTGGGPYDFSVTPSPNWTCGFGTSMGFGLRGTLD